MNSSTPVTSNPGSPRPQATVAPWTRDDLPAVRHIAWETWKATYGGFIPEEDMRSYHDEHYSLEALRALFERPSSRGFIARSGDGVPIGYMVMALRADHGRCSVSSIYVLPAFHGLGAGSLLMEEARTVARLTGCDRLWLGVMEKNTETIRWYERLGFRFPEQAPFQMGATIVNHLIGFMNIKE
jgi:ribosomal protein S18 acetylase RimI-like enzyme